MHEIVAAAAACGVSPIVRVAEGQHWMIKRAPDSGAHGVLVPMIETVDDARRVVEYSKFPPRGKRGFEALLAVDKLASTAAPDGEVKQLSGMEYLQQADESLVIAVQIETKGAVQKVDAIVAIDGIDVLFIGPFDLSVNMGCPISSADEAGYAPELRDAIQVVYEAGRKNGKAAGFIVILARRGGNTRREAFR
ncbi:Pyruvate/Phosphoenolpyruvate kinase-like domain-containing protein [Aspergillus desertorum]